jgi:acetyl esterase/lipase
LLWSWTFLAVTLIGAAFTFNAYLPVRQGRYASIPSFFAGWLTSELAAHHFAWQVLATVGFAWMGALDAWPGRVGLGITLASWAALLALVPVAARARPVTERALREALGPDWEGVLAARGPAPLPAPGRLVLPLLLRDPAVEVTRNLPYAEGAGRRHQLDVYRPRRGVSGAPVLLQIHGGAWVLGDKRQQALPLMLHMAARGWVCVAANYRLAPRATFPDPVIDLKRALAWIRQHVAEYGGDPDFIAVTGGSAGGHLSALVALTANDPEYQPGFESVDTRVQAAVPFYGVYDFTNRFGHDARDGRRAFLERVVMKKRLADDREAFERASPMSRIHADAPPFFILHGTHDSLVPVAEAREFARLLRATSRAPVAYAEIPAAQHAFEIFHSLRTRHVVQAVARFLDWAHALHLARGGRTRAA